MKKDYSANDLADLIVKEMKEKGYRSMSFVEIERLFEEYGYDYRCDEKDAMRLEGYQNLYVWVGWNSAAQKAITLLMKGDYHMSQVEPFIYLIDGKMVNLPIAKSVRSYKSPHWMPCVIAKDYPGMKLKG